jgi:hypothetical protein
MIAGGIASGFGIEDPKHRSPSSRFSSGSEIKGELSEGSAVPEESDRPAGPGSEAPAPEPA